MTTTNLTSDDGNLVAQTHTMFGYPDFPLLLLFRSDKRLGYKSKDLNGLFIIEDPTSKPLLDVDQAVWGYEESVPITVVAVDKQYFTGTKLRWKMIHELRTIAETYPKGSRRDFTEERPNDQRLGSTILHSQRCILSYRRVKG